MNNAFVGWLRAVDEDLVAAHIGIASESDDYDTAKRKLDALIDWHVAVATDPAVNGGWKLVPVEPSEEMLAATSWPGCAGVDYRHMLAAAPTPPVHAENTSQERVRNHAEIEHNPAAWAWRYEDGGLDLSGMFRTKEACGYAFTGCTGQPAPLYLHPPPLRMPEPMTQSAIFDFAMATLTRIQRDDWTAKDGDIIEFARAIEAEVLRRVKEANK